MAKKKFFLIIDTETTQTDKVADFGAVVCDKQGNIHASVGILVREFFMNPEQHPLFHVKGVADPLWGARNLPARYAAYNVMVENGSRMVASVPAVNRWLAKVAATYNPVMTAYNLAFDRAKLSNSGIDHQLFPQQFCLWHAAAAKWAQTKDYREFILQTVGFNPPTQHGNMSYFTNAEAMARFVLGDHSLPAEPHTALEDALNYELPILKRLIETVKPSDYMNPPPYNWRNYQVKDWFKAA
jgi:hypothetical protein